MELMFLELDKNATGRIPPCRRAGTLANEGGDLMSRGTKRKRWRERGLRDDLIRGGLFLAVRATVPIAATAARKKN